VGLSRFELLTPRLSSVCSNQLSYRPRNRDSQRARSVRPGSFKTRQNVRSTQTREYQIDLESTLTSLVEPGTVMRL
jgi:hypothetical protein